MSLATDALVILHVTHSGVVSNSIPVTGSQEPDRGDEVVALS